MHVLGQERQWRRELELEDRRQLVGRGGGELAVEAQNLRRVVQRVEDRPGEHDRPDRVQAVLERGDDAEVAAAAADAPEQIGVVVLAGGDELALRSHDVHGEEVVDRRAVLAHQPADPAAERQARDPGVGDDAADGGEPEELRLAVELAPQHARLGARRPRCRVDSNALHRRQVDHEPAVAERVAADSVATGAHARRADRARARSERPRRRRRRRCSARCRPGGGRSRRSRSCGPRRSRSSARRARTPLGPLGLARRCPDRHSWSVGRRRPELPSR